MRVGKRRYIGALTDVGLRRSTCGSAEGGTGQSSRFPFWTNDEDERVGSDIYFRDGVGLDKGSDIFTLLLKIYEQGVLFVPICFLYLNDAEIAYSGYFCIADLINLIDIFFNLTKINKISSQSNSLFYGKESIIM